MAEPIAVSILTPEKKIFEGSGQSVTLQMGEGSFSVWPGHIGLVALTHAGDVRIHQDGRTTVVHIGTGFANVERQRVQLLVDSAELRG